MRSENPLAIAGSARRCRATSRTIVAFAAELAFAQEALVDLGTLTCTLVEPRAKSGDTDSGGQFRDGRCTFKPGSGPEEIYEAKIEGVSLTPSDGAKTVIWVVKGQPGTTVEPGVLEQLYEGARGSREELDDSVVWRRKCTIGTSPHGRQA